MIIMIINQLIPKISYIQTLSHLWKHKKIASRCAATFHISGQAHTKKEKSNGPMVPISP